MKKTLFTLSFLKHFTCILFLSLPFLISAQGIFLDDWQPKMIVNPSYTAATATTNSPTVTVTVDAASTVSKVSKYVYGHNAAVWNGKVDQNAGLMTSITNLNPHIIRFPGGNMSNDYFWNASSKATCPTDLPPTALFNDQLYGALKTSYTMPLDSYYDLIRKQGTAGIICVNYAYARYGTSADPVAKAAHLAADWVRYDKGRTRYWEIGNENYGSWETGYTINQALNKDGQPATITGDLYGRHCKVFIDSMRKAALEVGNDIKIGIVVYNMVKTGTTVPAKWNEGVLRQAAAKADFLVPHFYFGTETDTDPSVILNTASVDVVRIKTMLDSQLKTYANLNPMPVALTEWNIKALDNKQQVSFVNGVHGAIMLGELIKNKFGQASRWDFIQGWWGGNSHGLFADRDFGMTQYAPRAPFFYLYYFQKYFGDTFVNSTVTGNDSILSYASTFSSGQSGVVLVNKGKWRRTINLKMNNFVYGKRYYYYVLTGGQDSIFSRKVFVNGLGPSENGGGPSTYATIKPYGTSIVGGTINIDLPKYSVVFMLVENTDTVTNSDTQLEDESISVYPNPAIDNFQISIDGNEVPMVELIDIQGKIIYKSRAKVHNIDSKSLHYKGVCIVRIIKQNSTTMKKLIIN